MELKEVDNEESDKYEDDYDPIYDIIDYLVRCAKISFKNAHLNEDEVCTADRIRMAHNLFKKSPIDFLKQFGKYLAKQHLRYFENLNDFKCHEQYKQCIRDLQLYHSDNSRRKRVRNRRFKALQKLKDETDYFTEKQMMYRNPLLYEQLIGQYLNEEDVIESNTVDNVNLTFLNLILETVDRNQMRELKNKQSLEEDIDNISNDFENQCLENNGHKSVNNSHWGEFLIPDTKPAYISEEVKEKRIISDSEKELLRQEFLNEMFNSFIEGRDLDIDYVSIDNDEQYDDLQQLSQDAEDKYFDSELNDTENLEEHMSLVNAYGSKNQNLNHIDDPLDVFMDELNKI